MYKNKSGFKPKVKYATKAYKPKTRKQKDITLMKLTKKVNELTKTAQEKQYFQNRGSLTVGRDYSQINLWNLPNCRSIFGTTVPDFSTPNRCKWNSCKIDFMVLMNNEYANVDMTIFVVSLKDVASNIYSKSTGVLTINEGLEYISNDTTTNAGQTLVNPKVFNIHYYKKLYIGNNGIAPATSTAVGPQMYFRKTIKIPINKQIINPIGNVSALFVPQDPSTTYYLLAFNNNITTDIESPLIEYNILNTMTFAC